MTRNYQKKRYHPTPMERGSQLETDFLADAREHHMEHLPGVFIALRLADYYKAKREGRILPENSVPFSPMPAPTQAYRAMVTPTTREESAEEEPISALEPVAVVAVAPKVAETITAKKGDGNFNFFFNDDDDDDDE